jgi:hypothetical protein
MNIIATTYSGGYDLFNGCPDLLNAKITDVKYGLDEKEYKGQIRLHLKIQFRRPGAYCLD